MKIIKDIKKMQKIAAKWRKKGLKIGFVPTMGFLHEGHLSLIKAAAKCDRVVVSVFVNPMQFGVGEDLDKYPRDLRRDATLCEENGVDVLFVPSAEKLYPQSFASFVDVAKLGEKLCGKTRPTHFRGVCTILTKFFSIIRPNLAYFGQKDAQQSLIVRRFARDLNLGVKIKIRPIVREKDGLAKSSRNVYLSENERKAALCLSRAVFAAQKMLESGERSVAKIRTKMMAEISREKLVRLDYLSFVETQNLDEISRINKEALIALAAYVGKTRLIDNAYFKGAK